MPTEDENLYPVPGGSPTAEAEETETEEVTPDAEESKEDAGETALVPKGITGGAKAGDTITIRIVKVYGDEVEIALSKPKPTETKSMMSANEEMDMMDKGEMKNG